MTPIPAIVDSAIRIHRHAGPWRFQQAVVRAFEIDNPEYTERRKMRRWTGGTDRKLQIAEYRDGHLVVPRGGVAKLLEVAERYGVKPKFEDRRFPGQAPPPRSCWPQVKAYLRDYQLTAVHRAKTNLQGLIVGPCGCGKTTIGAGLIARLDTPCIVLVHTRDLVSQWVDRIETKLGLNVGIVGGGEHELRPVTVATVQTLVQMEANDRRRLAQHFGLAILDEAHHSPAVSFREILGLFPARYRVGLTATPTRSDGLTDVMFWAIGRTLHTITHQRLIACGHLEAPRVLPVRTEFRYPKPRNGKERRGWWNRVMNALIADPVRNDQICQIVQREYQGGHVVLVLSGRVDHCDRLAKLLNGRGVPAMAMTGQTPKKKRQQILDDVRSGHLRVVCGGNVADEGLDLPSLSRIVQAFPGKAESKAIQRLGRLMRPSPGKPQAVLFDLVDHHIPTCRKQWNMRRKAYQAAFGG